MPFSFSKDSSIQSVTSVENVFITRFLPESGGNAVKVYLYGLFLCGNGEFDKSLKEFAEDINIPENEVSDCLKYWEEFGLLSVLSFSPLTVEYLSPRSIVTGKARKFKAEKYTDFTKALQSLLPSRMISTSEYTEYFSVMETYSIKPEAMLMIVKYCADRKGSDIGYRYISKVAKDFGMRGVTTVEKVEKELSSYVMRTSEIEKILSALSLKRPPEIEDLALLKKWTQEMGFETDNVVFAGKQIKKGSMKKLDELLCELYSMKCFSKEEIERFSERKKETFEIAKSVLRSLSVYVDVIDTVVDEYVNNWLSDGFTGETLRFVASHCFREGKNTLQYMNELLHSLKEQGIIDLSSVADYFDRLNKDNEFLTKVLATAGVNRRPVAWDRQNLATWRGWNFSDEMILEASRLSAGKNSPLSYMNGILSNWKNNNVFSSEEISAEKESGEQMSQERYNLEYSRRRSEAIIKAQKNVEKAMQVQGFPEIYSRLGSIEKDLALSEMYGNTEALDEFRAEKIRLTEKANAVLRPLSLSLDSLVPQYACKKCNDTGYVGTHRCDCLTAK